ncbi:MAG: hypothetical protein OXF79_20315 [Chloroflexi bacterium]|nr:hypothetical protein [Chloroflexota bacterium]
MRESGNDASTLLWRVATNGTRKPRRLRQTLLGDALIAVAEGLRSLKSLEPGWPSIRRTAASVSVPVAKILLGGNPLLRCLHRPQLPALLDNRSLTGDVYKLFEPLIVSLSAPETGPGTGISICNMGAVFPLHGMSYDAPSSRLVIRRPWSDTSLPLSRWGRQNLVQVCGTTQTIHRVLSDVRNQRGAHADVGWTRDLPQPVREFYALYASLFVVEVGLFLVKQAVLANGNKAFRTAIFGSDAAPPLRADNPLPRDGVHVSLEREGGFDLRFTDALTLSHIPHQGAGTTSYSTTLWFIRAPGETTERERAGVATLLRVAGDALWQPEQGLKP